MRRFPRQIAAVILIIVTLTVIAPLRTDAALVGASEISSQAAYVLDVETGVVLYSYSADTQRVPASLTKLMAAYVIYDAAKAGEIKLDSSVKISKNASEFSRNLEYSNVPLKEGESVAINKLLEVVIIRSACAATVALAEALSGNEAAFVSRMNQKAAQLGITAHFYDCYGGSPDNRISARGMAELARALIRNFPDILKITSKKSVTFDGLTYNSSDLLLGQYDGLDGLKTGYTVPAGYCFVGTAQKNGRRIIAVTMGSTLESRYPDTRALLDYGFSVADKKIADYNNANKKASPSDANLILNGVSTPLTAYIINDFNYFKLRDIAFLLQGTDKQFEVKYNAADGSAGIISGEPYTVGGSELSVAVDGARPYTPTTSSILYNGVAHTYEVYLIDNFNYFKLRDLGELLGLEIGWVQETHTVTIDTQTGNDSIKPGGEDHGDFVGFFRTVVAGLLGDELSQDQSIKVLAFDLSELTFLSDAEKTELLSSIKETYGVDVISAAIDELYAQGLISPGDLYFGTGLAFTFTNITVISEDQFGFSVSKWRGASSDNIFVDYSAVRAEDGTWSFTNSAQLAA